MDIRNHQLTGPEVRLLSCPKNTAPLREVRYIILHATIGADALSSARYLASPEVKASAHLVISRNGLIYQLVDFATEAWHAGNSYYQGLSALNHYSIGIELDNAGRLTPSGNCFLTIFGRKCPAAGVQEVCRNGHREYWQDYPLPQLRAVTAVCQLLLHTYPVRDILRHSDITARKSDPGPAFPFVEFCKKVKSYGNN